MAIKLFEHNETAYRAAVKMLAERGKAAVIHPTGTGKSFIGFKLCEDNPDKTICWLSPSRYIFMTQLENLAEVSGGYVPQNIKFCTYAKLMLMSDEEMSAFKPDFIILDEYHRVGAEVWGRGVDELLRLYSDVPVLGLSATAIRYLDNQRNMTDELFDGNVASEMTLGESIVRGILNPPKYILSVYSYKQSFEKYEKRVHLAKSKATRDKAEEYLEYLRRALDKAEKLDVLFDKNMTDRNGKYIVFCANFEHMNEMIGKADEWFAKVDKSPHIYSVYSDDPTASKSFAEFKEDNSKDHLKLLYCIDALNEGVHVPDISGVILLRPTISPIIYKQQIGRALSALKSREPVIFDIVNNIENLYSIDSIKEEMNTAIQYFRDGDGDRFIVNESFELIDKTADCKSLFDELEGVLSASWDTMFDIAKRYYEKGQNLDVPVHYYTEDGYSLGSWIKTQRRVYNGSANGILTQVQIDKLDSIGMRWKSASEVSWDRYYSAAKNYREKNGDLLPAAVFVDENGVDLGRWIAQLRCNKKSGVKSNYLTPENIEKLESIGMVWDVPDHRFDMYYSAAVRYKEKYGDLNVKHGYVDDQGVKLGQWLNNIRSAYKNDYSGSRKLSGEEIRKLNALGMVWESKYDKAWEDAFSELCKYKESHGNLNVKCNYVTESGVRLGAWIRHQQYDCIKLKRLSSERKRRLEDIGVSFEIADPWEEKYRLAEAYYHEHGNIKVPASAVIEGVWLNKWLNEQRLIGEGKRKKRLTDEQRRKLESIGMELGVSANDRIWNENYDLVKTFFEKYHHCDVAKDKSANRKKMMLWITAQRRNRNLGKLTDEQITLLDEIGMEWRNPVDAAWENGIAHLREYCAVNASGTVPGNYKCSDGFNLGTWLNNIKNKNNLTAAQKSELQAMGVVFDVLEEAWEKRFEQIKNYLESNHTDKVPSKYKTEDGYNLYDWVAQQKRRMKKNTLPQEKLNRLRGIGLNI